MVWYRGLNKDFSMVWESCRIAWFWMIWYGMAYLKEKLKMTVDYLKTTLAFFVGVRVCLIFAFLCFAFF